jgi:glycosyltransferase involved in cell wall biosynthesis
MRVLHLNSYYRGSPFYSELYDRQVKSGVEPSVYVPVPRRAGTEGSYGSYATVSEAFGKVDRFFFHLKQLRIYRDFMRRFDPTSFDVAHAHSLFSNGYLGLRLYRKFRLPYVVAVRSTDVDVFFKWAFFLRGTGIEILEGARKVVFISDSCREKLVGRYLPKGIANDILAKSETIPNGIASYWLANRPREPRLARGPDIRLVFAGRVIGRKKALVAAKATAILQREMDACLTVIGRAESRRLARRLGRYPFVDRLPAMGREALREAYANQDIFVMPSRRETFGLAYVEAMSQGLPVLYSRGEGFDGQFEEGKVGFSVDNTDPGDIARKALRCLADYEQISANCLRLCERFDWDRIEARYRQIYAETLAGLGEGR